MSTERKFRPKLGCVLVVLPIALAILGAVAMVVWQYTRPTESTRTPCGGSWSVSSPNWYVDAWCVTEEVPPLTTHPDHPELDKPTWRDDSCHPTEEEATAACKKKLEP